MRQAIFRRWAFNSMAKPALNSELFPQVPAAWTILLYLPMHGSNSRHGGFLNCTRAATLRSAEHRFMGHLRTGNGEPKSARIHHDLSDAHAWRPQ